LLQQKRDVLVMELMGVVSGFSEVESSLQDSLTKARNSFLPAYVLMGKEGLQRTVSSHQPELELDLEQHNVMGIALPRIRVSVVADLAPAGMLSSSGALDSTLKELQEVLARIGEYVEIVSTIWRLAIEVEKTQKRINALENVFIPESEETIFWIKSVMEENEREDLFRRKLLKSRSG
jgi:V/A-type H+-transporting ATPase subunit D